MNAAEFWERVDQSGGPDACHPWCGGKQNKGYGTIYWDGKLRLAHRVAFMLTYGATALKADSSGRPLPVDHQCHNADPLCLGGETCPHRLCCNVRHMRVTTTKINTLAGKGPAAVRARASHCAKGHEFTEATTYLRKDGRGVRECKICILDRARKRKGYLNPVPHGERTHCPQGHPYDEENTRYTPTGGRQCRECRRAQSYAAWLKRRKGEGAPIRTGWRTHCPQGHPYDEANTRVWGGKRSCRQCANESSRRRRANRSRTL